MNPKICWFHGRYGKDPSLAACPATGQETGTGEDPRTWRLPLAAQSLSFQLLQSATRPDPGTNPSASASSSGSVPGTHLEPLTGRLPRLLWLKDELSLIPMLVDTGGAKINCYGSRMIPLQLQQKRYIWDFEVVEV